MLADWITCIQFPRKSAIFLFARLRLDSSRLTGLQLELCTCKLAQDPNPLTVVWTSLGPLLGGYQDRLLGGPLGLTDLCRTVPIGLRRKDHGGEVLR
jgi:hypothetical protein